MEKVPRLTSDQRANLVAYLDGELEESEAAAIEKTLAMNSTARHEVGLLNKTWHMLDVLPAAKASIEFTSQTLTRLKVIQEKPSLQDQPWFSSACRGTIIAGWVAALAFSAVIGFNVTIRWIPNPNQQLIEELPLIENLHIYTEVKDYKFLKELVKRGQFDADQEK